MNAAVKMMDQRKRCVCGHFDVEHVTDGIGRYMSRHDCSTAGCDCERFVQVPMDRTMTDHQVAALRELRTEYKATTTRCCWDLPHGAIGFTLWRGDDHTPVVSGLITAGGHVVTDATVTL